MKKVLLLMAMIATASVASAQTVGYVTKKPTRNLNKLERKSDAKVSPLKASLVSANKSTRTLAPASTRAEEGQVLRYVNPGCTFFADGYAYMYQPAFTNIKWTNASEGYSEYSWFYTDINDNDVSSDETHLTTMYRAGIGIVPALYSGEDLYQFSYTPTSGTKGYNIMYGWEPKLYNGLEDVDLTLVDAWEEGLTRTWTDTYVYGTHLNLDGTATFNSDASEDWKAYFNARYGMAMDTVINLGYAIRFPQPAAPYVLRSVSFNAFLACEAGAELKLNIYTIDEENGSLTRVNTLTTTVDEDVEMYSHSITFNIESEDEYSMIRDYMVVDRPIVAELTGFDGNEKISAFIPRVVFQNTDNYYYTGSYAMTHVFGTIGEQYLNTFLNMPQWTYTFTDKTTGEQSKKCGTNWMSWFDAYYPYLAIYNESATELIEDEVIVANVSEEGETVTYYPLSYEENFENWVITDEGGFEVADWVDVKMVSREVSDGEETFEVDFLEFTVKPSTESRTAVVKVDAGGEGVAVRTFVIKQGDDANAIGSVEASANESKISAIYTVDGKRLAKNANSSAAKGVYVVKNANGTSSVVVK